MTEQRILVFDPYVGGHHPRYLLHLLQYWRDEGWPFAVTLAVPHAMLDLDRQLAAIVDDTSDHVRLQQVPQEFGKSTLVGLAVNDIRCGLALRRILRNDHHDACVMMYFDHLQLSTASLLRGVHPTTLSGIYFRPSGRDLTARKKAILRSALANPLMKALFVLDENAVDGIRSLANHTQIRWLPDGIDNHLIGQNQVPREHSKRIHLLLVGSISERKGIHLLASALAQLPRDIGSRIDLVVAGPHEITEAPAIERSLQDCRENAASVIVENRYMSGDEMQHYIGESDAVLVPYVNHTGSSNVLVRAAAFPKPVVGTGSGLIGELIRTNKLGQTTGADTPEALARTLESITREGIQNFDADSAINFARRNSASAFAALITETLIASQQLA